MFYLFCFVLGIVSYHLFLLFLSKKGRPPLKADSVRDGSDDKEPVGESAVAVVSDGNGKETIKSQD